MNKSFETSIITNQLAKYSKTGYFKVNLIDDQSEANDEWYECFGAPTNMRMTDVLSQFPYVHPVDHYSIKAFLDNAVKGFEKEYRGYMRVRIPGRDVTWRWYQVHMLVTKYAPEEKIVEIVGMHYEVTGLMGDSEHSILALSQMSDLLKSFNTIPWTYDLRTQVIVTNRSLINNVYGFDTSSHQMSRAEFLESVLPEYREDLVAMNDRIESGAVPYASIEIQMHIEPHMPALWVDFTMIAQEYDESGRAVTAIGTTTIIQERKMAEKAMEDAKMKAEHANKVKTNFIANMSHEFRTPLNAILGFSTIMGHSSSIEERMQCLGAIQSSGAQLLQMVDDMIEFALIEAGEIELKHERIEIGALIERVAEECKPRRKAGVSFEFESSVADLIIHGDESKIAMVAKHLIGNAAKYTERGGIKVKVDKDVNYTYVVVSDTGKGMSHDTLVHIFDRFYKGSNYVPGMGLGLSIVKNLIELWNGSIKVESEEGKGTTFTFTIPLHGNFR